MKFVYLTTILLFTLFFYISMKESLESNPIGINEVCETDAPGCFDVSYNDPVDGQIKQIKGKLDLYYYIDETGMLAQVPSGYIASPDKRSYIEIAGELSGNTLVFQDEEYETDENVLNTSYQENNYDITYHEETPKEIPETWVRDSSGNVVSLPYFDVKHTTLYYDPNQMKYDQSNYVPNYQESVWLSLLNKNVLKTI